MKREILVKRDRPLGKYAVHLIENGHRPGVLSGSILRLAGQRDRVWKRKVRDNLCSWLWEEYGIWGWAERQDTPPGLSPRQYAVRVWRQEGEPVRLLLEED